ncbi:MAG: type II toxin-antitoxin system PemK/MazF family toxin [Microbacteriaceae bacterium]|nr:type II toxin-antitoxin system PemK/MazF family toxin [Microbacteriaceae bacterium]
MRQAQLVQEIRRGDLFWAELDPVRGREQAGRRPVLVIASDLFLEQADTLAIIVPCTTNDRGWPNHIRLTGVTTLNKPTFAMTEQPRTITRDRLAGYIGSATAQDMDKISVWLRDFLEL